MRIATLLIAAGLALRAAAASAQDVSYDLDKGTDFSRFRTYAWVRGTPVNDELNHQRIVAAVDAQLAARGFAQVEPGANPDVFVSYHVGFGRDVQVSGFSSGWGGYRWGPGRSGSARADQILTGMLVVVMVDARTRTIVWRAIATKDVDVRASPEKREKNINKTAEKLFKSYPPRT